MLHTHPDICCAFADVRKEKNSLNSRKIRLEDANKALRDEIHLLQTQPKRISKKYIEGKLATYYKEHPKCKNPMFLSAVYVANLQEDKDAEFQELEQQAQQSKSELSSAARTIRRLEREASDWQGKVAGLLGEIKLLEEAGVEARKNAKKSFVSSARAISSPSTNEVHAAPQIPAETPTVVPRGGTEGNLTAGREKTFVTGRPRGREQGAGRGNCVTNNFYTVNGGAANSIPPQRRRKQRMAALMQQQMVRAAMLQQQQQSTQLAFTPNMLQSLSMGMPSDGMW